MAIDAGSLRRGAAIALLLLTSSMPAAAESMRCGSKLIVEEDSIDKVLYYCGEPASKYRTWIVRQPRYYIGSNEYVFPGEEDVPVDLYPAVKRILSSLGNYGGGLVPIRIPA